MTDDLFIGFNKNNYVEGIAYLNQQFNDISFFVEDEYKENFYFQVLKKVFPDIKLNNIYALNGLKSVIDRAKRNKSNKNKIYIVDKDFSDILNKKVISNNLFYLKRYSIENYLIEKDAIISFLIEEQSTKLKTLTLDKKIKIDKFNKNSLQNFYPIVSLFLIIQKYKLGIKNAKHPVDYFFNSKDFLRKEDIYNNYKTAIIEKLQIIDKRKTIKSSTKEFKEYLKEIHNYPGKYLLKYLYFNLKNTYKINCNFESFMFRIAKNCELNSLKEDIRDNIVNFTK